METREAERPQWVVKRRLVQMTWHITESTGQARFPHKPFRRRLERRYFLVSQWPKLHPILLGLAIKKIARIENASSGPVRARFRAKRLRAVSLFKAKFGSPPIVEEYQKWHAPND
jgi:hypothetical protein